jgi:hypothetical protein
VDALRLSGAAGSGPSRFLFWAYADDADHDPRIAEVVKALNIDMC